MSIVRVAKLAGVGTTTVSRYINGSDRISPGTAGRIARAMKSLGYRPKVVRPGPKSGHRVGVRTGTILFLSLGPYSPQELYSLYATPVLLGGIHKAAAMYNMSVQFAHSRTSDDIPEFLDEIHCDGVIIFGRHEKMGGELLGRLRRLPAVWTFRSHSDINNEFDHVFYDNGVIGEIAAGYCRKAGARSAAVVNLNKTHPAFLERRRQFLLNCSRMKLKASAIEYPGVEAGVTDLHGSAVKAVDKFLSLDAVPEGVFVVDETQCVAFSNELKLRNRAAAEKTRAITCSLGNQFLQLIDPPPASILLPFDEVGAKTVHRLLRRINRIERGAPVEEFVRPELRAPSDCAGL